MPETRTGTISLWRQLSPVLAVFRLAPEPGHRFPAYQAGQYIALRREKCRLTRRVTAPDGRPRYLPDLDEHGRQKRGPVAHAYSVASPPFRTDLEGYLELFVALEISDGLGRFTESLFDMEPRQGGELRYVERIAGDFTLARRAAGVPHALLVASGTGIAPFASIVRQLDHEAAQGRVVPWRVTLLFANRTAPELAFHDEFAGIAAARRFDFAYVPAVSRPRDGADGSGVGQGRVGNLLRHVLALPLREEEDLQEALRSGADARVATTALERATRPQLPAGVDPVALRARIEPTQTVILTCGNPAVMADVREVAERRSIRFEREEW
jgi:ferredoxin-NADP reductase